MNIESLKATTHPTSFSPFAKRVESATVFCIFPDGKRVGLDDVTLRELARERDRSSGLSQHRHGGCPPPVNEQCGKVTLLVTWKNLKVFPQRQTSQSFQLD